MWIAVEYNFLNAKKTTNKRDVAFANMNRSNVIHCMPYSLNCV